MADNVIKNCPKCGNTIKINSAFCSNCGQRIMSEEKKDNNVEQKQETQIAEKVEENIELDANSGDPLDYSQFDRAFRYSSEAQLIDNYVSEAIKKVPNSSGLVLVPNEMKKVKLTAIFSLLLILIMTIYVAYHIGFMLFLLLIVIIVYLLILKSYSMKKYLIKEVNARPDEKIDYVVSSAYSSAVNSGFKYKFIRIVMIVLAVGILLACFDKPHLIYEKQDDGYVVRYYTYGILKNDYSVVIPSKYKGFDVVGIRGDVFKNCNVLKSIELPNTIKEIRGGAFQGCSSLEEINLPVGITEIHGSTFENCYSLKSIVIPVGVTRIGGSAFRQCHNLTSATIPETVKEIGSSAFRGTSLSTVCVSKNAYINERAFKETYATITYYEDGCQDVEVNYYE
jgi:uncharacterized Zn finger protein (UPF0148 family)